MHWQQMKCKVNNSLYKLCTGSYPDQVEWQVDCVNLMSLSLAQSREIQRIPQTSFFKGIVTIIFQQPLSFYLTVDFCESVLFQTLYFFYGNLYKQYLRLSFWLIFLFLDSQTKIKYVSQHRIGECLLTVLVVKILPLTESEVFILETIRLYHK